GDQSLPDSPTPQEEFREGTFRRSPAYVYGESRRVLRLQYETLRGASPGSLDRGRDSGSPRRARPCPGNLTFWKNAVSPCFFMTRTPLMRSLPAWVRRLRRVRMWVWAKLGRRNTARDAEYPASRHQTG